MTALTATVENRALYSQALSQWDPITAEELINSLSDNPGFLRAVERVARLGSIDVMRMPSPRVADSTLLLVVKDQKAKPLGVVHVSQAGDPDQVKRSCSKAKSIAEKLGGPLNSPVLLPLWLGEAEGRSCSFTQLKVATECGWVWSYQKRRMRQPVLEWLFASARKTIKMADPNEGPQLFFGNLSYFDGKVGFTKEFNNAVASAKSALTKGKWTPRHMVDHNDLWKGNVMLENKYSHYHKFYVIDWAAANLQGYGILDFITFSKSFGVRSESMAKWLSRYAELLDGNVDAILYQYLAGMGHLGRNLNNFPYDRFVQKVSYEFAALHGLIEHASSVKR